MAHRTVIRQYQTALWLLPKRASSRRLQSPVASGATSDTLPEPSCDDATSPAAPAATGAHLAVHAAGVIAASSETSSGVPAFTSLSARGMIHGASDPWSPHV